MIRSGQPLYQNSLKRPIAVHPGELVTVLVTNGPVSVRAQLQPRPRLGWRYHHHDQSGQRAAGGRHGNRAATRANGAAMKKRLLQAALLLSIAAMVQGCAAA